MISLLFSRHAAFPQVLGWKTHRNPLESSIFKNLCISDLTIFWPAISILWELLNIGAKPPWGPQPGGPLDPSMIKIAGDNAFNAKTYDFTLSLHPAYIGKYKSKRFVKLPTTSDN